MLCDGVALMRLDIHICHAAKMQTSSCVRVRATGAL